MFTAPFCEPGAQSTSDLEFLRGSGALHFKANSLDLGVQAFPTIFAEQTETDNRKMVQNSVITPYTSAIFQEASLQCSLRKGPCSQCRQTCLESPKKPLMELP